MFIRLQAWRNSVLNKKKNPLKCTRFLWKRNVTSIFEYQNLWEWNCWIVPFFSLYPKLFRSALSPFSLSLQNVVSPSPLSYLHLLLLFYLYSLTHAPAVSRSLLVLNGTRLVGLVRWMSLTDDSRSWMPVRLAPGELKKRGFKVFRSFVPSFPFWLYLHNPSHLRPAPPSVILPPAPQPHT